MTLEEMAEAFDRNSDEYLRFDRVPNTRSLPSGTRAIQYGLGLIELASVEAKK